MGQFTSYWLYQKYEQRGSQEPIPVYPNIYSINGDGTMPLVVRNEDDTECGYVPPVEPTYRWTNIPITQDYICDECNVAQYRWVNLDPSVDYYCEGTTKYYKQKKQVSYDGGQTWQDVSPAEYQKGGVAEEQSTDCNSYPPIEPIDMTGKLYVAKTVDGTVYGNYDCFSWSNTITPESYSTCVGCAVTGAYTVRGIGDYVYIGTCSRFDPYALRGYTEDRKANIAIYFAGDNVEYSLSRGLFLYTHIREVLIGGNNVSFSIVPDTTGCESIFEGGSGDISEITRRLSTITPRCFFEGDFGNSIIFDRKVNIMKNAFSSLESNLTFNGGFTYENTGDYATDTWEFRNINENITITLNGNASDYPANITANIRSVNPIITVIDNTI